jgi:hypothetical protein
MIADSHCVRAVFAQHGYFVIAINPAGHIPGSLPTCNATASTTEFTDPIQGDWGGKPITDPSPTLRKASNSL